MSQDLSSKALLELVQAIDRGDITDETIHLFVADPQIVYRGAQRAQENEERLEIIPKGFVVIPLPCSQHPQLAGKRALYVAAQSGEAGYYVVCGNTVSRQFKFLPQGLCVAQGKPAYFVKAKADGSVNHFVWGMEEHFLYSEIRSLSLTDDGIPLIVVQDDTAGNRIDCGMDAILAQSANILSHPVVTRGVLAYVEQAGSRAWLVVDGVPGMQLGTSCPVQKLLLWEKTPIAIFFAKNMRVHHVLRGNTIGKPYRLIADLFVDEAGVPIYSAQETAESPWLIVYGDREIGFPEWQSVGSPKFVEGHLLFTVRIEGKGEMAATWKGDAVTYGSVYDRIDAASLTLVNGALLYTAFRLGKSFVVWKDGEGKSYDEIFSLHVEGDCIVYGARRGREFFRVTRLLAREEKPEVGALPSAL